MPACGPNKQEFRPCSAGVNTALWNRVWYPCFNSTRKWNKHHVSAPRCHCKLCTKPWFMEAMDLKTVLLTFRRSFGRRYSDTVVIHVFRHRKSTVRVLPGGEASRGRCSASFSSGPRWRGAAKAEPGLGWPGSENRKRRGP